MNFFPKQLDVSAPTSYCLDLMRVIAASLVVFGHARALFFYNFPEATHKSALTKAFYLFTGVGHEAVVVFFVLSGYLISLSVWRMHEKDRWSWSSYLIQRLSRLWIVLIPALLLTLFWDVSGLLLTGSDGVYSALTQDSTMLKAPVIESLRPHIFLGNILFLQTICLPTFGSNGPLWSLSYEFWYYLLFPAFLLIFIGKNLNYRIKALLFALAISFFIRGPALIYFSLWFAGALVHHLPTLKCSSGVARLLLIFATSGLIFSIGINVSSEKEFLTYFIAFFTSFVIWSASLYQSLTMPLKNVIKKMADWSYSLYLLHVPFLLWIHALLHQRGISKWQFMPSTFFWGAIIVIITFVYAWSVSKVTESHTSKLRTIMFSAWNRLRWSTFRQSQTLQNK